MVKKIIIGIFIVSILLLGGYKVFFRNKKNSKAIEKLSEKVSEYHSCSQMKIYHQDEKRNYKIEVDYLSKDQKDLFRISILDENINQEQIIIKNNEGVFVLSPSINKVYEFDSDYPLNSPKPYLYHSMQKLIDNEYSLSKVDDGYLISAKANFENYPKWNKEEVKFSSSLKPLWVNIYDNEDHLVVEITFTQFDFKTNLKEEDFKVEKNVEESRENVISQSKIIDETSLPLLPSSKGNNELVSQTVGKVNNESVYILTFKGDKEFTLLQSIVKDNENIVIEKVNGEFIDTYGGVCFKENKRVSFIYNGVSYDIYSNQMSKEEMLEIIQNLDYIVAK